MVFIHLESSYESDEDFEDIDNDSFISYGSNDVSESSEDSQDLEIFEGTDEDFEPSSSDSDEPNSNDAEEEDDPMSQASTEVNENLDPQPDQSGSDTEIDDNPPNDDPTVEVQQPQQPESIGGHNEEVVQHVNKKIKLDNEKPKEEEMQDIPNESNNDDQKCSICLEVWSNAGEHRLCCLKCGHLFGLSCITQWLNLAPNAAARKCPECNTKSARKDIRVLYAKQLICTDTSEIENLQSQLNEMRKNTDAMNMRLKKYEVKETVYQKEIDSLKLKNKELLKELESGISDSFMNRGSTGSIFILKKRHSFDIPDGSRRVMAYNIWDKLLIVSSNNSTNRVFLDNFSVSANFNLHQSQIRDLSFQNKSHSSILLSVAFDKKINLTDTKNHNIVHSYQENSNLWSCCWSKYNEYIFFVGGQRGDISEYDIRQLRTHVSKKENPADRSPVTSIISCPGNTVFPGGGFILSQLNSCCAYSFKEGNYIAHPIDLDGPFTSLRYNEKDEHILVSCRPSKKNPTVRHIVCSIEKTQDRIKLNVVHTFNAGTSQALLSRPCYVNLPNDTLVVGNNQSLKNITAWSVSTGEEICSLPIAEPMVDSCQSDCLNMVVLTSNSIQLFEHRKKCGEF